MKIRNGFISNSSSTSFCIYGARINEEIDEATFLSYFSGDPNGDGQNYLGLELASMDLNETRNQFQERINIEIKRILGQDAKCDIYEESYYNG